MSGVTQLLRAIEHGDENAPAQLMATVYDELHRLAASKLAGESPGNTLQATALVHEAYLRLLPATPTPTDASTSKDPGKSPAETRELEFPSWESRAHFFGAAAEAMRRILIDAARRRKRLKRGGDRLRVDLDHVEPVAPEGEVDLLALDEALAKLEELDQRRAEVVKLRYFCRFDPRRNGQYSWSFRANHSSSMEVRSRLAAS